MYIPIKDRIGFMSVFETKTHAFYSVQAQFKIKHFLLATKTF